jgi:hypothetical protein
MDTSKRPSASLSLRPHKQFWGFCENGQSAKLGAQQQPKKVVETRSNGGFLVRVVLLASGIDRSPYLVEALLWEPQENGPEAKVSVSRR